jgi:hypothetical protein
MREAHSESSDWFDFAANEIKIMEERGSSSKQVLNSGQQEEIGICHSFIFLHHQTPNWYGRARIRKAPSSCVPLAVADGFLRRLELP